MVPWYYNTENDTTVNRYHLSPFENINNFTLKILIYIDIYLHFHCESLNEPFHLRCSYLHEQIYLSHTNIHAILAGNVNAT